MENVAGICFRLLNKTVMYHDGKSREMLLADKAQNVMLNVCERHAESDAVITEAGMAFCMLAGSTDHIHTSLRDEILHWMLKAMELNTSDLVLQVVLCNAASSLSCDPNKCKLLIRNGGVDIILKVLRMFPNSSEITYSSLCFLDNVAEQNEGSYGVSIENEIFTAMAYHQDDPKIQEAACRAVTNLLNNDPSVVDRIGEDEHQLSLHSCVLAALNIHVNDQYVFQSACCALHDLAFNSTQLQDFLVAKGTFVTLVDHMRCNQESTRIQEWGFRVLHALCYENYLQEELLTKYDILTDISRCLHRYGDHVGVLEEALGVLACLAGDMDIVRRQCLLEQVHVRVVEIINAHDTCLSLLKICFETLVVFAGSEEQEILSGILDCVERIMGRYKYVRELQWNGCILMQLLASLPIFENYVACAECVSLVSEALMNFPSDIDVKTEAAVAMVVLAQLENGLKAIVDLDAYEHLFKILDSKDLPASLLEIAAEALLIISGKQINKDHMLQWALMHGHWKETEWLLCVDADINGATLEKMNIMVAAEQSNNKMMRFLLNNGVSSHTQEALKVCQAKGDHAMIGLLLRHIGLERKEGVLAWANLNLGSLKGEYFNSLLIDSVWHGSSIQRTQLDDEWIAHFDTAATRRQRKSSRDVEIDISPRSSFASLDEDIAYDSDGSSTTPNVKSNRRKSSTGASLAFSTLDPRLEGSFNQSKPFVHLEGPSLRNSYPGHPDGLLSSDANCGNLLPSPSSRECQLFLNSRTSSVLGAILQEESSNDSLSLCSRSMPQTKLTKSTSLDYIAKAKVETKTYIQYADFSLNRISDFDVIPSSNSYVKTFFRGLIKLELQSNELKSLPAAICSELTSLKELNVAENCLCEFPYEILNSKVLEKLNLSKNDITIINESRLQSSFSLRHIDVSKNKLAKFPSSIDTLFPALITLNFSDNKISKLPSKLLGLRQLRTLNLSKNRLECVPSQFLEQCFMLEMLDLSKNCLIALPAESAFTYNRLSHVKLSHNQLMERAPWYVPKFVLQLQNLVSLDISHNKITQMPAPSLWGSRYLRDLNLSYNRISKLNLDSSSGSWSSLSKLNVAHNKIKKLPAEIGRLTNLTSLDITFNELKEVPNELGRLKNLLELPLDGLTLNLHPSVINGTAQEICTFLYSKLKNSVYYRRLKLMVVGKESRGKTSLLRALQGIKQPSFEAATVGIKVNTWKVAIPKQHLPKHFSKKTDFVLNTWDLAGQADFHCTHQCFMSSRALYLAVFDASKGPSDLEYLRPWLLNISASAPGAVVFVVGTHADEIVAHNKAEFRKDLVEHIQRFMESPGFPACEGLAIVSSIGRNNGIESLREEIVDIVAKYKFHSQLLMEETVPKSYVQIEDLLADEATNLIKAGQIPVISKRKLIKIVQDNNLELESQELQQAVKFLHEVGALLHFDDPSLKLTDCYFIHPEWLSQMLAQVVTVKEINPFVDENGVFHQKSLPILFRGENFPIAFIDNYLRLMQKFEVVFPLDNENFLIPSKLPEKGMELAKRVKSHGIDTSECLKRYYQFSYIPVGFWGRLISRLMFFESPMHREENKKPVLDYWRNGVFRFWSATKFFIITTSEEHNETMEIIVPVSQHGYELIGFLVDHVDSLIEEWYPGLNNADPHGNLPIKKLVPCLPCAEMGKEYFFTVERCISQSYESDSIWCPSHEDKVALKSLAPDVLFADIDGRFLIDEKDIDSEHIALDSGSFGNVYQTKMSGSKNVAVKVFRSDVNNSPHRFLRQEVTILQLLRHPSLVSMVGVLLRPHRALVMELAPKGSLRKVLACNHLSRGMQHRIASQVAEGLAYLHKNDIVYRDMKPSNILIFSLSMGIPVTAKISDYGISQYITPQGFTGLQGSPGYRAPEVETGYWMYNKEADIFSLGVTFFELVTGGRKPFKEGAHQRLHLDNTASLGTMKPLKALGCPHWPDMQTIIVDCLNFYPERRPTAESISKWLSTADSLCLKQEVSVCKGQAVECMAIYKDFGVEKETMELWIGSGDASGQSQISWLSLIEDGDTVSGCRGMILKEERILCMCVSNNNLVLVGTKKGNIVVFDAQSHTNLHTITGLGDSVLCLSVHSQDGRYFIAAGLANGEVAIFEECQLPDAGAAPILQFEVLQSELGVCDGGLRYPVTCLGSVRRKLYCGVGGCIAVIDPKRGHTSRILSNGGEPDRIIYKLSAGKVIWTSSKDSSVVRCLDSLSGTLKGTFDCAKVLCERFPSIELHDCRVLSIYDNGDALWIGCGGGHVIIIEPTPNFRVLAVISRHSSTVRCITGVSVDVRGKQISIVLTGGIGFLERSQSIAKQNDAFGHVLIWEAELPRQCAYLDQLIKTRNELL